jgi:uncharacterized membrane protein YraQ (UPF0718 family)
LSVLLFIIGLVPLLVGPLVVQLLASHRRLAPAMDGFVFVSVGGIALLHVLPHAIGHAGIPALLAALVGFIVPWFLERGRDHAGGDIGGGPGARVDHRSVYVLLAALLGLAIHSSLDGVALAAGSLNVENGRILALGVIIHRLPAGVAIWWFASRAVGSRRALFVLAMPVLFSAFGFGASHLWPSIFEDSAWSVLQALLFGSLVHVLFHEPPSDVQTAHGRLHRERWQVASFSGAALGGVLLLSLELFHLGAGHAGDLVNMGAGQAGDLVNMGAGQARDLFDPGPSAARLSAANAFLTLALESALPILVGFAAAGLLQVMTFSRVYRWMGRGGAFVEALKGAVVGVPLNVCSCSVLPVYRALVSSNVSRRSTLAFLIGSPEVGIATLAISLSLLGWQMSLMRVLSAVLLASLLTNGLLHRVAPKPEALVSRPAPPAAASGLSKLAAGLNAGFGELLDHTLPWLLLGLGIAATLEPLLSPHWIVSLPREIQIPLAAVVGVPFYVCASGSTPLVAKTHQRFWSSRQAAFPIRARWFRRSAIRHSRRRFAWTLWSRSWIAIRLLRLVPMNRDSPRRRSAWPISSSSTRPTSSTRTS